jgi:murein DD-endopeptidase MepM/ murein hydrolase activator NlpD
MSHETRHSVNVGKKCNNGKSMEAIMLPKCGACAFVLWLAVAGSIAQAANIPVVANNKGALGQYQHGTYPSEGSATHLGVDIVSTAPGPVVVQAFAPGIVVDVIRSPSDRDFKSLGYMVMIEHPETLIGRKFYTVYLHLTNLPDEDEIAIGKSVERKLFGPQVLGDMGATGNAKGRHLHFEIRFFKDRFHPKLGNIYGKGDIRSARHFSEDWADPAVWFAAYPRGMFSLDFETAAEAKAAFDEKIAQVAPTTTPPASTQAENRLAQSASAVQPGAPAAIANGLSNDIADEFHTNELAAIQKYSKKGKIRIAVVDVQMSDGKIIVAYAQTPSSLLAQHQRNYEELDRNFTWQGWFKTSQSFGPAMLTKYMIVCVFDPGNLPPLQKGNWAVVSGKLTSYKSQQIIFECSP